ncbi:uncharacterized protein LOC122123540 isoform X4 [Dipodomys spectabilis]|uniref:uncharacterized protein LOC122123540 isoform X4 n=1 Tax=Dipodomys spectabilis TaxID=105255 RepID=UPI001C53C0C8|nr:uncharacterized protein LOC122123540 isoform X4 [Dipodomys spectabilis]
MVLGFCCQREGLHRSLYLVHIFILAGAGYYYFQMYMGKPALDYENAEKSTQPKGETVRPVWGLMDKCYPAPAQASPQTTAPKEEEAQNDTTPQEETDSVSQEEGQEKKMVQQEVAVHPSEDAEVEMEEEKWSGMWGAPLWRKFWLSWFPASDNPKIKSHE